MIVFRQVLRGVLPALIIVILCVKCAGVRADDELSPISGQGFTTSLLDEKIFVPARDRRSVLAWDLGFSAVFPDLPLADLLPFGSFYIWKRPEPESYLLRGVFAGVYNEAFAAIDLKTRRHSELWLSLDTNTVPFAGATYIEGRYIRAEEQYFGYVRPGIGWGVRKNIKALQSSFSEQDNMREVGFLLEPSFVYFKKGTMTSPSFVSPKTHPDMRIHVKMREDRLLRNLIELPHSGLAWGADAIVSRRLIWENWGNYGQEVAAGHKTYFIATAYGLWATRLPSSIFSDRHHFVASLHAGAGTGLDRWSEFTLGGGPSGEDFYGLARPVMPGAALTEISSHHYAIAQWEYRWEPVFFCFLSARGSLSALDRERWEKDSQGKKRQTDLLPTVGARLTSGFLGQMRVQIEYNFNTGILRQADTEEVSSRYGSHEVVTHISGMF